MSRFDASGMMQDSTGDPAEKVGDTFVIHMDRESLDDFVSGDFKERFPIVPGPALRAS